MGARRGDLCVLGRRCRLGGRCRACAEGVSTSGVGGHGMLIDADCVERVLPGAGVMTKHHPVGRWFLRRRAGLRVPVLIVGLVFVLLGRSLIAPWRCRRGMPTRNRRICPRSLDRVLGRLGAKEINRVIPTRRRCRCNAANQHYTGGQERYQTSSHIPSPLWRRWSISRSPVGRRPCAALADILIDPGPMSKSTKAPTEPPPARRGRTENQGLPRGQTRGFPRY